MKNAMEKNAKTAWINEIIDRNINARMPFEEK